MDSKIRIVAMFLNACLMAAIYGALHNQISYTISPEYFTKFKFRQFGIAAELSPRVGAAIVGVLASWWMGVVIAAFLVPMGLVPGRGLTSVNRILKSFSIVLVVTFGVGLFGLGLAFLTIRQVGNVSVAYDAVADDLAFNRAGALHNASYIGGVVGMIAAVIYLYWSRPPK